MEELNIMASSPSSRTKTKKQQFPGCIVLEDKFTKSPPADRIKNPGSWKERYFLLIKLDQEAVRASGGQNSSPKLLKKYGIQGRKKTINGGVGVSATFCLAYWNNEQERRKGVRPIRVISLDNCTVTTHNHPFWQSKYPHMISLKTQDRVFFLCSETEQQKKLWLDTLVQATESKNISTEEVAYRKPRSGSIDPIYETFNQVLAERRPSESSSVWTNDSGYGDSPFNSRPTSTIVGGCDSPPPALPPFYNQDAKRLSLAEGARTALYSNMNKGRSFSTPNLKETMLCDDKDRFNFGNLTDRQDSFDSVGEDDSPYVAMASCGFTEMVQMERDRLQQLSESSRSIASSSDSSSESPEYETFSGFDGDIPKNPSIYPPHQDKNNNGSKSLAPMKPPRLPVCERPPQHQEEEEVPKKEDDSIYSQPPSQTFPFSNEKNEPQHEDEEIPNHEDSIYSQPPPPPPRRFSSSNTKTMPQQHKKEGETFTKEGSNYGQQKQPRSFSFSSEKNGNNILSIGDIVLKLPAKSSVKYEEDVVTIVTPNQEISISIKNKTDSCCHIGNSGRTMSTYITKL